jgi:hypothetical protein
LWKETNGRDGHPDWRGIYEKTCLAEQWADLMVATVILITRS